MLILSRKKNESIVIGDGITVTVVEIRGDKVRLGFEAPEEIPIHRREVWVHIHPGEPVPNEKALVPTGATSGDTQTAAEGDSPPGGE